MNREHAKAPLPEILEGLGEEVRGGEETWFCLCTAQHCGVLGTRISMSPLGRGHNSSRNRECDVRGWKWDAREIVF